MTRFSNEYLFLDNNKITKKECTIDTSNYKNILIIKTNYTLLGKSIMRAEENNHYKVKQPSAIGTLVQGEIVYTDIENYTVGELIIVNPHSKVSFYPCALSKYVVIFGLNTSNSITYQQNTILSSDIIYTEILACVLSSIGKIGNSVEPKILVLGCGLIGMLHLKVLKILGLKKVYCTYNSIDRKKMIEEIGYIPISMEEVNMFKYDVIFECVGKSDLVSLSIEISNDNCRIILFGGFPKSEDKCLINLNKVHYKNLRIIGTYHFEPNLFNTSFELISKKIIDFTKLKSHSIKFENFEKEYVMLDKRHVISLGIEFEEEKKWDLG